MKKNTATPMEINAAAAAAWLENLSLLEDGDGLRAAAQILIKAAYRAGRVTAQCESPEECEAATALVDVIDGLASGWFTSRLDAGGLSDSGADAALAYRLALEDMHTSRLSA